jgi:hypothetical protein
LKENPGRFVLFPIKEPEVSCHTANDRLYCQCFKTSSR